MSFRELEEAMMTDLLRHSDIHKRHAAKIFNIHYDEVTDAQRNIAKKIGFGILYGMDTYRIKQEIKFQQMPKDKKEK